MAASWTPEAPALWFRPRGHVKDIGGRNDREYLLWPVFAWRVVAPVEPKDPVDLIMRAVMGFCRAGVFRAERIAARLDLHPDLVAFLLADLLRRGWLTSHGELTEEGARALEDSAVENLALRTVTVFQDPWTGDLWPRVAEQLEYARLEHGDGFPKLQLGTTGAPWLQHAFLQFGPDNARDSRPSPMEVLRANRRNRRALARARRIPEWLQDAEEDDWRISEQRIKRVRIVDARPEPLLLATFLYVPREEAGVTPDWHAADPFGLGSMPSLRRNIEALLPKQPALADRVRRLLKQRHAEKLDALLEHRALLQAQAEQRVLERFGARIRSDRMWEPLVDLGRAAVELELFGEEAPAERRRAALGSIRRCLERLLSTLIPRAQLRGTWRAMSRDGRDFNRGLIEGRAVSAGAAAPIPPSFCRVPQGQVRSVCDYDDAFRLRPLVAAQILATASLPEHPLRLALGVRRALLQELEALISAAAEASHDQPVAGLARTREHTEVAEALIALLLSPAAELDTTEH